MKEEIKTYWEVTKNYAWNGKKPKDYDDDYGFDEKEYRMRKHKMEHKIEDCLKIRNK